LKNKEKALQDLTKGTDEWNDAVSELNNEILDLISKYPELSEFVVSKGNGVLGFTEEAIKGKTVEDILNDYKEIERYAQSAKIASNIKV
jgi:hypothetical protein